MLASQIAGGPGRLIVHGVRVMEDRALEALLRRYHEELRTRFEAQGRGPDCLGYASLLRAARGTPLPPAAAEHLAACPACSYVRDLFARELAAERASARRRALVPALAAGLGLLGLVLLLWQPWKREGDAYAIVLESAERLARAELRRDLPELFPATAVRGAASAERTGIPDDVTFLPPDPIEFQSDLASPRRHPFSLTIARLHPGPEVRLIDRRTVRKYPHRQPAPPGGWPAGAYEWLLTSRDGDPVAGGRFEVLGPPAQQIVQRAERELASMPERLARVYYVLGLRARAEALLPRLPLEQREAVRKALQATGK